MSQHLCTISPKAVRPIFLKRLLFNLLLSFLIAGPFVGVIYLFHPAYRTTNLRVYCVGLSILPTYDVLARLLRFLSKPYILWSSCPLRCSWFLDVDYARVYATGSTSSTAVYSTAPM